MATTKIGCAYTVKRDVSAINSTTQQSTKIPKGACVTVIARRVKDGHRHVGSEVLYDCQRWIIEYSRHSQLLYLA
jgi:hypothetical protein